MGTHLKGKKQAVNPSFYISLAEDKYYFPGDSLKGTVHLHLQKPVRTHNVRVNFTGEICTFTKDKDVQNLFRNSYTCTLPTPPHHDDNGDLIDESKRSKGPIVLEAKLHTFPFEFVIPDDLTLPSYMELYKEGMIRYKLVCIHDKAQTLSSTSKCEYIVPILERIDVSAKQFHVPREQIVAIPFESLMMDPQQHSLNDGFVPKAVVQVNVPKFGYVRGEKITISVTIKHVYRVKREAAVTIALTRVGQFLSKHIAIVETPIRTSKLDLDIDDPYNLQQVLTEKILIPTSTPPTIDVNGRTIYIQYKLVVTVDLADPEKTKILEKLHKGVSPPSIARIEIPIIVGTLPFATTPIDEDEDEYCEPYVYDMDDETTSIGDEASDELGDDLQRRRSITRDNFVSRSDSNASHMSTSSLRSKSSISSHSSCSSHWTLSRHSSTSTTTSGIVSSMPPSPPEVKSPATPVQTQPIGDAPMVISGPETPRSSVSARVQDSYFDTSRNLPELKTESLQNPHIYSPTVISSGVPENPSLASMWEPREPENIVDAPVPTNSYRTTRMEDSDSDDEDGGSDDSDDDLVSILKKKKKKDERRNRNRFIVREFKDVQLNR